MYSRQFFSKTKNLLGNPRQGPRPWSNYPSPDAFKADEEDLSDRRRVCAHTMLEAAAAVPCRSGFKI